MEARALELDGAKVFEPSPITDDRGFFVRTLDARVLAEAGLAVADFVQESQSRSAQGVVRGLHGRMSLCEGKLVRCARGAVFDVIVDLRPWSPTFLRHEALVLDDVEHRQVWVPPGFAHGFAVLTEHADVCYRMDAVYQPGTEFALAWDDPDLGIEWPVQDPLLSERDRGARPLAELLGQLPSWFGVEPPGP